MSIKKAGLVIFTLLIILIIVLLTMKGCSIEKKSEQNVSQNNVSEEVMGSSNQNSNQEKVNLEVGESSKVETPKEGSANNFVEISGGTLLGGIKQVDALVSSKKTYLVDDKSYAYSLALVIPSNDEYKIVNYYCPKKTYDAIMSGEVVKVDYYVDNNGVIAVDSISK